MAHQIHASRNLRRYAPLVMVLLGACGGAAESGRADDSIAIATTSQPVPTTARARDATVTAAPQDYCDDLLDLTKVLDSGGSEAEYNDLLARVAEEAPPEHTETWSLMLTLSTERFTYENFNPALDSLEDISAELDAMCPRLDDPMWFVGDDGRLRQLQPD